MTDPPTAILRFLEQPDQTPTSPQDRVSNLHIRLIRAYLWSQFSAAKLQTVLSALDEEGLLDCDHLASANPSEIQDALMAHKVTVSDAIRATLVRLAGWLIEHPEPDLDRLSSQNLRDQLTRIKGLSIATVDSILLLGLERAIYPVDRASYRVMVRHGWLDPTADYEEARARLESIAPEDPAKLALISTWLERLGRDYCKPAAAKCQGCPLEPLLPDGGPVFADSFV